MPSQENSGSRGAIIVLGMHRSGTSCVGNLLTKLGIHFGDETISIGANRENPKGFFERRDVRDVCDTALQGAGCDWWAVNDFSPDRVPYKVRAEVDAKFEAVINAMSGHEPWFIKEPRLCLVWPLLASRIAQPVFVHVWRHPLEVAQSLAARNGFPIDFGTALWEAYVLAAHASSRGQPSIIISYNKLIQESESEVSHLIAQLRAFGVNVADPSAAAVRDAVDPKLHRNQAVAPELEDLLTPSQRRLMTALTRGDVDDAVFFEPLSAPSRLRIDDWARREGVIFELRERAKDGKANAAEVKKLRSDLAAQLEKAIKLETELKAQDSSKTEIMQLRQQLQIANVSLYDRKQQLDKLKADLQPRMAEIETLRGQLASADAAIKDRDNLIEQLRGELEARNQEIGELRADVQARIAEIEAVQSDLASRDGKIAQLEARQRELDASLANLSEAAAKLKAELRTTSYQLEQRTLQLDQAQADLADRAAATGALSARIAALTEDLKRSDRYLEEVRRHFARLRDQIAAHLKVRDEASRQSSLAAAQLSNLLRYGGASSLTLLLKGADSPRLSDEDTARRSRRALFLHYLLVKRRKDAGDLATLTGSGLFDPDYYRASYPDVASSGLDPLLHYVDFGAAERRNPSPHFDTGYYLNTNPDVAEQKINPLLHYVLYGRQERRPVLPEPPAKAPVGNWMLPPPPLRAAQNLPKPRVKRAVIYTAVSGGYDDLKPPGIALPGCDFVVFSDHALEVEGWQVRPLNYVHHDPTRAARFVKLHPHLYFPDYDHSIWIDANIGIRGDIRVFFDRLSYESPIGIFLHPLRDCIYVEAAECIKRKKDAESIINQHVARYRAEGFPEHAGLWETNVVARRHNDPSCIALMTAWWREMEIGSRRDQLSLPVVSRRLSVPISPLDKPGANARDHALLTLVHHPAQRAIPENPVSPAVVRKPVDVDRIAIDIGICVHNSPNETRACIASALRACRPQDRVIVVDDASNAETATLLDQFAKDHAAITLVRHEQNCGYTASANAVLREARAPWTVLLNSDTVVPPRALVKMIAAGEQFDRIGVVGPLSNAASWQTVPQLTGPDGKFLVNTIPPGRTVEDMDRLCEELSDGNVLFVPLVNGFCFAVRQTLVQRIGKFDEERFPVGYGEEDDFCLRAGAAGYLCAITTDAYVYHAKSASFTPERRLPLVEAGAKALRQKHSPERLVAATEMLKRNPGLKRVRERLGAKLNSDIFDVAVGAAINNN